MNQKKPVASGCWPVKANMNKISHNGVFSGKTSRHDVDRHTLLVTRTCVCVCACLVRIVHLSHVWSNSSLGALIAVLSNLPKYLGPPVESLE